MSQITGIVYVHVNGKLQRSKEGASLKLGGSARTWHSGHKVYGYTEKINPSEVDFTICHVADDDIVALNETVDATLRFETDTGKVFLINNAGNDGEGTLTGGEGDFTVKFFGDPAVAE